MTSRIPAPVPLGWKWLKETRKGTCANGTSFDFQVVFTLIISPAHFLPGSGGLSRAQAAITTL